MKPLYKGLAVAFLHILIVLSLGGKLLYDRATKPRIWVRTASIDPELPLRGRYLTLNLQVRAPEFLHDQGLNRTGTYPIGNVDLAVENGQLVAHKSDLPTGIMINSWNLQRNPGSDEFFLSSPVLFFIPEHAEQPRLSGGGELWAEVTVPRKGPPRPIQLAIKRGQEWIPLTYR